MSSSLACDLLLFGVDRLDTMFHQIHHFSPCALLTVLLGLTMDVTSGMGSIQLIPQYPVINGSVTLSLTGITEIIEYVAWHKGRNTDSQSQILSYFPGSASPLQRGLLYDTRFVAFNNGSLQMKDLRTTDGGDYTVKIQTREQVDITGTLTVYESVTKPKITASSNQSKENSTFTLTCDTSKDTKIRWTRRGSSISLNTKLSEDNKTLTFSNIKRNDSGEYQCEAQNLVSKDSSDPYKVTVAYGPDNVKIEGPLFVRPGSPITLSCSADSFPSPEYQWKVNDKVSEEKTNKYIIRNASYENQGLYMCVMKNTVTDRTAAASIYVNVTAEYIEPEKMDSTMFVGIVVAVLLLLILIIAIIYLYIIHKRRKSSSDTNSTLKDSSRNGQTDIPTQAAEQHELQYASIEFSKSMPRNDQKPEAIYENRSPQVAPPPTDNVVYSELKLR